MIKKVKFTKKRGFQNIVLILIGWLAIGAVVSVTGPSYLINLLWCITCFAALAKIQNMLYSTVKNGTYMWAFTFNK